MTILTSTISLTKTNGTPFRLQTLYHFMLASHVFIIITIVFPFNFAFEHEIIKNYMADSETNRNYVNNFATSINFFHRSTTQAQLDEANSSQIDCRDE